MNSKVFQSPQLITRDTVASEEPQTSILPKSMGVCPYCGTEQAGAVYRISAKLAAFLKITHTETFVPDEHRCLRKVVA
jgi:hypothetical protein